MGLDMYLHEKVYLSNWPHDKERPEYDKANQVLQLSGIKASDPGVYVSATVMYWRKSNQIHKWFVDNVQSGVDDCGDYYVSTEQLAELRDTCQRVLDASEMVPDMVVTGEHASAETGHKFVKDTEPGEVILNTEVAEELLPNQSGFFFGSTDYDQYYIDDLKRTVEGIDRVLKNKTEWSDFEYHSSW